MQALHLSCRVRDHIERLDSGVAYAVDDLAVTLRAMLSDGPGNQVLNRLNQLRRRGELEIQLSRPPSADCDQFSVGSIPTWSTRAVEHGASWTSLRRWASRPVLHVVCDSRTTTYTWSKFLNTYANKWGGAHLDGFIPTDLQIIDRYDVGGYSLSGYLLRMAAVQVWSISQILIADALFVVSGAPLEGEKLITTRMTAEGGISYEPSDRTPYGELQWLDQSRGTLDFLNYTDPNESTSMVIPAGQASYKVACAALGPVGTNGQKPAEFVEPQRARTYNPQPLTNADFAKNRTIRVSGRFLTFDQVNALSREEPVNETDE